jgi:hypothetical protein
MPAARVHTLQVLKDVKAAVVEFSDAVNQTLTSVDSDINRVTQWLTQDRPAYWKAQVRRREDDVTRAQTDIMRKRIIAAPEPASVVEEQKVLDHVKRRLAGAQRKLENVRRWAPMWEREALLYKTTCRGLAEAIHRDMPAATVRLDQMMASLDAYLRIAVPQTDAPPTTATDPEAAETPAGPAPEEPGDTAVPDAPPEEPAP